MAPGTVARWRLRWRQHRHFLHTQARDLLELWLLPGMAALLPWRWCFALYRRVSHWDRLYAESVAAAAREAMARGWLDEANARAWMAQRRLVTLVDHADFFLSRTRSDRWLARHVRVEGAWPAPGRPAILCTFHWGAGTWALRDARLAGMRARMMVAGLDSPAYAGRPVMFAYAWRRVAMIARELQAPTLDTSASLRTVLKTLDGGEQVMAVVDVPADEVEASCTVGLLGQPARMPRALLRLATQRRLPVVVFLCGIDLHSGERWISLETLPACETVEELAAAVFVRLDAGIRAHPALWHFWGQAPRFWGVQSCLMGAGRSGVCDANVCTSDVRS